MNQIGIVKDWTVYTKLMFVIFSLALILLVLEEMSNFRWKHQLFLNFELEDKELQWELRASVLGDLHLLPYYLANTESGVQWNGSMWSKVKGSCIQTAKPGQLDP